MKTKSIPNLKFKDLGNDAFSVSTPTEHISLNSVILLVAKKQSGKTFFASNLMNQLKQVKACDRIFIISDTFNSNKKMMEHLDIKREDIFSPNDPNVIPEITKRIEAERDDLLEYRQNLKMYNQYRQLWNKQTDMIQISRKKCSCSIIQIRDALRNRNISITGGNPRFLYFVMIFKVVNWLAIESLETLLLNIDT